MDLYYPEGMLLGTMQNYEYISSERGLERALDGDCIIEGTAVLCDHDMNLHVALGGGMRGIIPRSEVEYSRSSGTKDIAILTRVGKPVCFTVTGFERDSSGAAVAMLSRRHAQIKCMENYIATLMPGDVIKSKVTHIEGFGAFVDIGCGIISLLSIDSISVSRIAHPSERLSVGECIYTVVKSIDERGRIFVSSRELLGSWEENVSRFSEGQTVRGVVRSVENYGIFVELTPNLAGLAEYKENVYPEQTAAVYIKSIIPDKMKVKLIIIDTADEPIYRQPLEYFINPDETQHIDLWKYSPEGSKKVIESTFT